MTVSVLVPSSLCREAADKRAATLKLGYVARAATVFRADRLVVFDDAEGERHWGGGFVETVLRYAATPPYLRKEVWGERDELEYAGVLPPLRAVPRTGSGSNGPGSSRQGIVTEVGPDGRVRVNCGLQHPISLAVPPERSVDEGERVTVRVSSRRPVRARLVDEPLPGLAVERADLRAALGRSDAGVRIATSRHGEPLSVSRLGPLVRRVAADGATVAFGAPERGLPEMLGVDPDSLGDGAGRRTDGGTDPSDDGAGSPDDEADSSDDGADPPDGGAGPPDDPAARFDRWVDAIPDQGSETVRTEEATFAVLACLRLRE